MYRIRIHGRGGQGIKMSSRILGTALFRSGYTVQDAPKYGAERRGAPIHSYVRAGHGPINERGVIQQPDLVIVADDTLVTVAAAGVLSGLSSRSVLLINSHDTADTWRQRLNLAAKTLILPASDDVGDRAELPYIGATCAGAAARLLGNIERDILRDAIVEELAPLAAEVVARNCDNALVAYDAMHDYAGVVSEGVPVSALGYAPPDWIELPFEEARISAPDIHAVANSVQVRTGLWRTMRPVIDYDLCNKCWWVCSTLCPDSAITIDQDTPAIDYDHCKGCMVCAGVCPTHAIAAVPEYLAQRDAEVDAGAQSKPPSGGDHGA